MYYYLSIGTNIRPHLNAPAIVKSLCQTFGQVTLWPFCITTPEQMQSQQVFFNSLAIVHSSLTQEAFKSQLNQIEQSLGRDRADPLRSEKDRTADIDIIHVNDKYDLSIFAQLNLPRYLRKVILQPHSSPPLKVKDLPAIKRPTAVNLERRSGHITIIKQIDHSQIDGVKTALGRD